MAENHSRVGACGVKAAVAEDGCSAAAGRWLRLTVELERAIT